MTTEPYAVSTPAAAPAPDASPTTATTTAATAATTTLDLSPSPADADAGSSRLTRRLRAILAVVLVADVLDLMDSTITNIAAPSIVGEIGGGQSLVKWLGTAYALSMGVLLVVGGRLGDRFGPRRMFLLGLGGFVAASVACGLSVSPGMMIAARLVQGAFGALLIPQGFSVLMATFSREQLPRAFSAFGPVMGASAVLGPIVAGLLIDADIAGLSWRPVFLINIVIGGAGLVAAWRLLPSSSDARDVSIDGPGSALLGAAMLGLMYGLIEGSTTGWPAESVVSLVAGGAAFAAFCLRQTRTAEPLILPSLLGNRGFTSGLLVGLAFFAGVNGLAYVVSLFLQSDLGFGPSGAALALAPLAAGIIVSAFVSRPLVSRWGRRLVVVGLGVTLAGAAGLWLVIATLGTSVSAWSLAPALVVLGLGMGACFSSIFDVAIGEIAPEEAGSASGSLSAVQQLASAMGSAVVTTVYFGRHGVNGAGAAMSLSIAVVAGLIVVCLGLVRLMPRSAPEEPASSAPA